MRGRGNKIFGENINQIQRLREQGLSINEIAAKFAVTPPSIHYWLNKKKKRIEKTKRRKLGKKIIKEIKRLRKNGIKIIDIAKFLGIAQSTVLYWASTSYRNKCKNKYRNRYRNRIIAQKEITREKKIKPKISRTEYWIYKKEGSVRTDIFPLDKADVLELIERKL